MGKPNLRKEIAHAVVAMNGAIALLRLIEGSYCLTDSQKRKLEKCASDVDTATLVIVRELGK